MSTTGVYHPHSRDFLVVCTDKYMITTNSHLTQLQVSGMMSGCVYKYFFTSGFSEIVIVYIRPPFCVMEFENYLLGHSAEYFSLWAKRIKIGCSITQVLDASMAKTC